MSISICTQLSGDRWNLIVLCCLICFVSNSGMAQELPTTFRVDSVKPVIAEKPEPTRKELVRWLKNLNTGNIQQRKHAFDQLQKAKLVTVNALKEKADSDDREISVECVKFLGKLIQSKDKKAVLSAKTALRQLEKSEYPAVSQQANQILINAPHQAILDRITFQSINIQLRGASVEALMKGRTVTKKFEEYGRKATITEKLGEKIDVKISKKYDCKEKTIEVTAKDLFELRRKNKEAYDLYRKHHPKVQQSIFKGRAIILRGQHNHLQQEIVNGVRATKVTIDDLTVEIYDTDEKEITVKTTTLVDQEKKTVIVKAKDLLELQKLSGVASRTFLQYTSGPGISLEGIVHLQLKEGSSGVFIFPLSGKIPPPGPAHIAPDPEPKVEIDSIR